VPPPSEAERLRLQTQLEELQLARQFFSTSGEDPQQLGQTLAECDAKISALKQTLERQTAEPAPPAGPPALPDKAVFDEAIARQPDNPALYVARAQHLLSQREHREALAECNHALDLLPTYYAAFNARGLAYHCLKKHSAAIRDFERAIYENPDFTSAYVHLAATYNAVDACYDSRPRRRPSDG
jgi:tetratricopeptide (TPR) repeat protein